MPIYEYVSEDPDEPGRSCRICKRGFELRRPVDRAPDRSRIGAAFAALRSRVFLAVVAFERGLESLLEGGRFTLNDTLAELREMEKTFAAPRLSVPDDVYTPETAATLEEEAADQLLLARLFLGAGNVASSI